jgi:hypothetical protein
LTNFGRGYSDKKRMWWIRTEKFSLQSGTLLTKRSLRWVGVIILFQYLVLTMCCNVLTVHELLYSFILSSQSDFYNNTSYFTVLFCLLSLISITVHELLYSFILSSQSDFYNNHKHHWYYHQYRYYIKFDVFTDINVIEITNRGPYSLKHEVVGKGRFRVIMESRSYQGYKKINKISRLYCSVNE